MPIRPKFRFDFQLYGGRVPVFAPGCVELYLPGETCERRPGSRGGPRGGPRGILVAPPLTSSYFCAPVGRRPNLLSFSAGEHLGWLCIFHVISFGTESDGHDRKPQ